jgi:hypothetical protein
LLLAPRPAAALGAKLPWSQPRLLFENNVQVLGMFEADFFRNGPKREIRFTQQLARAVQADAKNFLFG